MPEPRRPFGKPDPKNDQQRSEQTRRRLRYTLSHLLTSLCLLWLFQIVLLVLVRMETGSHCGYSGDGSPVAPDWIPLVLERDFESKEARREKTDVARSSGSHRPNDG